MKVVIDGIYTTQDMKTCSYHFMMQSIMKHILSKRQDVFFYYAVPENFDELGMKWDIDKSGFYQHKNIKYVPVRAKRDRIQEYLRIVPQLEEMYSFQGDYWDADLYITARTLLMPILRQHAVGTRTGMPHAKKFIIVDGFPLLSYKGGQGAKINPMLMDLITVTGYVAADVAYTMSGHEYAEVLDAAKKQLSPANAKKIKEKTRLMISFPFEKSKLKSKNIIEKIMKRKKQFTIAYTRRFNINKGNIEEVLKVMGKHWIYNGKHKVRCVFTSATDHMYGGYDPAWMEMVHTPREDFWKNAHEEFDVMVNLSLDEGFSLSLYEPLSLGVPGAIINKPWVKKTLGPDYPFYVNNTMEAYTVIKCFHDNYGKYYKIFAEWLTTHWDHILEEYRKLSLVTKIEQNILDHEKWLKKCEPKYVKNAMGRAVVEYVKGREESHIEEVLKEMYKKKLLNMNVMDVSRIRKRVTWGFTHVLNDVKLGVKSQGGYEDASTDLGHLRRKKND